MSNPKNKTFTCYVRCLVRVEVEAKNEDEAIQLAVEEAFENGDWETTDVTVEE